MDFKLSKGNLNFNVKTVESMPSNSGTDNGVVVVTATPMKNWVMSPDMPTNPPRTDGDIWIPYSVNGAVINAVKNGGLMINPMTALQYVGGAWSGVNEMIYPDGKKARFLYNAGNECVALTGGWEARAQSYDSTFTNIIPPTVKKGATGFTVSMSVAAARSGVIEIQNDVDLTNVKSVIFEFKSIEVTGASSSAPGRLVCSILPRSALRFQSGATKFQEKIYDAPTTESNVTFTVDVSDLSGSYNVAIGIAAKGTSSQNTAVIADCMSVKMEVS